MHSSHNIIDHIPYAMLYDYFYNWQFIHINPFPLFTQPPPSAFPAHLVTISLYQVIFLLCGGLTLKKFFWNSVIIPTWPQCILLSLFLLLLIYFRIISSAFMRNWSVILLFLNCLYWKYVFDSVSNLAINDGDLVIIK